MSLSIDALRNLIVTSLYGRRLGFDKDDYLIGAKDQRLQVQDIATTSPSTIYNYGVTRLTATGASSAVYSLPGPVPVGLNSKVIVCVSTYPTTTVAYYVQAPSGVTFVTSGGSSFNQLGFAYGGQAELIGLTTAQWGVQNNSAVWPSTY